MWPFYAYSNYSLTGVLRFSALFGLFLYQRYAGPSSFHSLTLSLGI
jgi:hypothetical protein